MAEYSSTDLRDFSPSHWFNDNGIKEVLYVFFPTSMIEQKLELGGGLSNKTLSKLFGHPIKLITIELRDGLKKQDVRFSQTYSAKGLDVHADVGESSLLPGHYLVALTPIRLTPDGSSIDEIAYSTILSSVGMLCARLGHTAVLERALELRYSTSKDEQSQTSQLFENYWPPSDVQHVAHSDYVDLLSALYKHCPKDLRQRLKTAFKFLGNTAGRVDPLYRFANAWIALEVICGSSGKALQALKKVAPPELEKDADRIKSARDGLFHKGAEYHMSYHEEHWIFAAIYWHISSFYRLEDNVHLAADYFDNFVPGKQVDK